MNPFQQYIKPFSDRLASIEVEKLQMEEYPATYLGQLLHNKVYYLHMYAAVLHAVNKQGGLKKADLVLVDYGCGNGLLGLFAKFCGCKQVYLNDHNPQFLKAAKLLSKAISIEVDAFIDGDINDVELFFKGASGPDAIIATDVIEHIYNLQDFFITIARINNNMVTVFTTASVKANYFKSKQLIKLQHKDEHTGSNALHASSENPYAGLPFKLIREQIIKSYTPELAVDELAELIIATRGLNKVDILQAVDVYKSSGKIPEPPAHATNTCDPITGSWTERLLTIEEYRKLYENAGFTLSMQNGFYNEWHGGAKSIVLKQANKLIRLMGKRGECVTPFITLTGKKR
ncbi:MAG: class I SAM-dependent methyltransferase [Chitinophagaceae bacterium]|nr:class I SAM-dependent methyltransferase [Chitinophagaceae bacterium]